MFGQPNIATTFEPCPAGTFGPSPGLQRMSQCQPLVEHVECNRLLPHPDTCSCADGYSGNWKTECNDVDECTDASPCPENSECRNVEGAYNCSCNIGYSEVGAECIDIDECLGDHGCDQICGNIPGSYTCDCNPGMNYTKMQILKI